MDKEFYNRYDIRDDIKEKLKTNNTENTILFIIGSTGKGKSALIDYIESLKIINIPFISLKFPTLFSGIVENGVFLERLFNQINEFCKNTLTAPFDDYRYNLLNLDIWKNNTKEVIKNFTYLSSVSFSTITNNDFLKMKNYIEYVLNKINLLINIENFQNIDFDSLDFLCYIMKKYKGNIFIFQYTLTKENNDNLSKQISQFQDICTNTFSIYLDTLKFEEAKKLLPPGYYSDEELRTINSVYENGDGNLYQIKTYQKHSSKNKNSFILNYLKKLENNYLYVLYLISFNGGIISQDDLTDLLIKKNNDFIYFSIEQYHQIIETLVKNDILTLCRGKFSISDSIINELRQINTNPIKYVASTRMLNYYQSCLSNNKNYQENFYHLFSLCIELNDKTFMNYIYKFKEIFSSIKYPQQTIQSIRDYTEKLEIYKISNYDYKEKIFSALIEIMIDCNDANNAEYFLNQIYCNTNMNHIIMLSKIFLLKGKKSNIQEIDDLFNLNLDDRTRLIVSLSKLQLMMKLCSYREAFDFASILYSSSNYKNFVEYGFVISNYAEFEDNPKKSLSLYLKSLQHFKKYNNIEYQKLIYSNLSMSYGYLGDIKNSKYYNEKLSFDTRESAHMYYNNSAVLDILENRVDDKTIDKLYNALLMSIYEFEQLIIHNNLLIAYVMSQDDRMHEEYNYIKSSKFEQYENAEFLLMNYRNLLFYSRYIDNKKEINTYIIKIRELISNERSNKGVKTIGNEILNKKHSKNKYYYSKLEFHPEFTCYWGVPLLLKK